MSGLDKDFFKNLLEIFQERGEEKWIQGRFIDESKCMCVTGVLLNDAISEGDLLELDYEYINNSPAISIYQLLSKFDSLDLIPFVDIMFLMVAQEARNKLSDGSSNLIITDGWVYNHISQTIDEFNLKFSAIIDFNDYISIEYIDIVELLEKCDSFLKKNYETLEKKKFLCDV